MLAGKKHTFIGRTIKGVMFSTPSPVGSLVFNDPNQFLQFPREGVINLTDATSPFTIEAWIKPTSIRTLSSVSGIPTPVEYGNIIIGDSQDGGNNWSLQLFNNKLTFYRYNGGARFFTSNTRIPLNAWTHVAVSYDGASTLYIFINGVLDRTFVDYSPPQDQYNFITIGNLFDTGSSPRSNGAYAYQGLITNLRINDNQSFYHLVSPFKPTAPLGHISGTTLMLLANENGPTKDSSPVNVAITNIGSVAYSSQYPTVGGCSDNDAKVLMVGWLAGARPLTRDNENHYTYYAGGSAGDETLSRTNTSSRWIYYNSGTQITRSLNPANFPWEAKWPSPYTATKVCPAPSPTSIGIDPQDLLPSQLIFTFADKTNYLMSGHTNATTWNVLDAPNSYLLSFNGSWRILKFDGILGRVVVQAVNPSTDSSNIPLTGWIYNLGSGLAVNIRAA